MTPTPDAERPGRVTSLPARRDTAGGVAVTATGAETRSQRLKGFTLAELSKMGEIAVAAGMFSGKRRDNPMRPEEATMKILAGLEIDIPITQALAMIDIIDGGPAYRSQLMAGMIKRSGRYRYKIEDWTDERCEISWLELQPVADGSKLFWDAPGPNTIFTLEDAKRAGLVQKTGSNYTRYPKAMLFARALSQGARAYCPDVMAAGYTSEEMYEEPRNPEGYDEYAEKVDTGRVFRHGDDVIDGEVVDVPSPEDVDPSQAITSTPVAAPPDAPTTPAMDAQEEPPRSDDTPPPVEPEPVAKGSADEQDASPAGSGAAPPGAPEPSGEPTQSLLDLIGSTDVSDYTQATAGITTQKLGHLRKVAKPLDSGGLSLVVAWATRNDGVLMALHPAKLTLPRYGELAHFFEHATSDDRVALVSAVKAWKDTQVAQGDPEPPADETGQRMLA